MGRKELKGFPSQSRGVVGLGFQGSAQEAIDLQGNSKDDVTLSSGWMGGSAQMGNRSPPSLTTSSLLTMFLCVENALHNTEV